MLLITIALSVILQTTIGFSAAVQIVNYILLVVNAIYTAVFTVFVAPTYREHKALVKDYNNRMAPSSVELKAISDNKISNLETKINKVENDISELNHSVKNITTQLTVALKRKEDEPDWSDFIKAVNKLNDKL